jgi:hypothetical protein
MDGCRIHPLAVIASGCLVSSIGMSFPLNLHKDDIDLRVSKSGSRNVAKQA